MEAVGGLAEAVGGLAEDAGDPYAAKGLSPQ